MKIQICTWKTCKSKFSSYIKKRLESDVDFYNWENIKIEECMCTWNCKDWPTVIFDWNLETHVSPAKASKIVYDKKQHKKSKKSNKDNN